MNKSLQFFLFKITSNEIIPWLPYFFTKCFKKRFGVIGVVEVFDTVDADEDVCSATTGCFIKCRVIIAVKTYFSTVNVILRFAQCEFFFNIKILVANTFNDMVCIEFVLCSYFSSILLLSCEYVFVLLFLFLEKVILLLILYDLTYVNIVLSIKYSQLINTSCMF